MLVLDTDPMALPERTAAFQDAISGHASTSVVTFEDDATFRAQVHLFPLEAGTVFNVAATGNTLRRTSPMARHDEQNAIALALPVSGVNRFRWGREERLLSADDLLLVDLDAPYEYGWSGSGTSYAFQVDRDRLGLSMVTVTRAATRLPSSPLYGLVRDHVRSFTTQAHHFTDTHAAERVGDVTVELMRALIETAALDSTTSVRAPTILVRQITSYVRRHLFDPELTPQRIAAAHHISLRHLYKVCKQEGIALEPWIIARRLEAVKSDLVTSPTNQRTIAAIAHARGFANPSHFARRFRMAYGVTPSEWRESHCKSYLAAFNVGRTPDLT